MRKFLACLLACAIGILGCSCDKNTASQSSNYETPTLFCSKYELPFDYSGIYDIKSSGETLIFYAYQETEDHMTIEKLVELNLQTGNTTEYEMPSQAERLIAFDQDENGKMWYLVASHEENTSKNILRLVSADQQVEYDITETVSNAGVRNGDLQLLAVNSNVFSILSDHGIAILLDGQGNLMETVDTKIETPRQVRHGSDSILIAGIDDDLTYQATTLNCTDYTLSKAVQFPDFDAAAQVSACTDSNFDFVVMEDSNLYGATMDGNVHALYHGTNEISNNATPIALTDGTYFIWGITMGEKTDFGVTYLSEFHLLTDDPTQAISKDTDSAAASVQGNTPKETQKTITLALTSINAALTEEVKTFNAQQSDFQIDIKDYSEYGDQAETQLQLDIASGDLPDIIECGIIDLSHYIDQGLLTDLGPMIQQDYPNGELNQSILDATSYPQGQFVITPLYGFKTLVALQGNPIAQRTDYNSFFDLCADETSAIHFCTGQEALRLFLTAGIQEFINFEEKSYNFNSETFISLLNACVQCSGTFDIMPFMETDLSDGVADLIEIEAYSYADVRRLCAATNPAIVGYPSNGGGTVIVPGTAFALTAGDSVEEAWCFIQYMLEEDVQAKFTYKAFPLRSSSLDQVIADEKSQMSEEAQPLAEKTEAIIGSAISSAECGIQTQFLRGMILDCTEAFFAGNGTAESTAKDIQSKIEIYLSERS